MNRDYNIERKYFDKLAFEVYSDRPGDITLFACPVCNEGNSYGKKHRFHWKYDIDSNRYSYVNCFNCGFGMDFEFFIRKYGGNESFQELLTEYKSLNNSSSYIQQNKIEESLINSPRTTNYNGLFPIKNSKKGMEYLKDRLLTKYSDFFLTDKYDNIVIPFYNKNRKIYGYQTRIVANKQFWFEIDDINKKFKTWNFYNINWEEPVYIFEGVEDALSSGFNNVIATLGKTIHPFIFSKLKKPIICFDNDIDGKKAMYKQVIKYNCDALVFPREFRFKDFNEMLKAGNSQDEINKFIKKNIMSGFRLKVLAESIVR